MSGLSFGANWRDRLNQGRRILDGQLPGKWGLLQKIVGHWVIPKQNRGILAYTKAVMGSIASVYDYYEEQKEMRDAGRSPAKAWLSDNGYEKAFPHAGSSFESFVCSALSGVTFHRKQIKDSVLESAEALYEFDIGNDKNAYFIPGSDSDEKASEVGIWWDGPYLKDQDLDQFMSFTRDHIWKSLGSKQVAITTVRRPFHGNDLLMKVLDEEVDFVSGRDVSNDLDALASRLEAFVSRGFSRTIMFYGPPGTGKTTLSMALANRFDGRLICIEKEAVNEMGSSLYQILRLISPDLLLMNDIDRECGVHKVLLDVLEDDSFVSGKGRGLAIFLTANDLDMIDPAILRPGRVHELRETVEPGEETRKLILNYYKEKLSIIMDTESFDLAVKEMDGCSPADIREFAETAKSLGVKMALEEISRIKSQREFYAGGNCADFNNGRGGRGRGRVTSNW